MRQVGKQMADLAEQVMCQGSSLEQCAVQPPKQDPSPKQKPPPNQGQA